MIPPSTPEFHRDRHDEHMVRLRSSMQRAPTFASRRTIGSWLVSVGLRLAPDQQAHPRLRALDGSSETSHAPGCVSA